MTGRRRHSAAALAIALAGLGGLAGLATPAPAAGPMTLKDYMALTGPAPSAHVAYGPGPLQYAEYFRPAGPGPFPVAVLIHGGCFLNAYQGMAQMRGMAGALAAKGVAVWSVEYRGTDSPGGGYPGMYRDVGAAIDLLAAQAKARGIDIGRLVVVGHSAGTALALWAAGRGRVPAASLLHASDAPAVPAVVALGGYANLRPMTEPARNTCGIDLAQVIGTTGPGRADPFADTNPADLTPPGLHVTFINGDRDSIAPPAISAEDAAHVRAKGGTAETIVLPDASHYDEVAVTSPAWALVGPAILRTLGVK